MMGQPVISPKNPIPTPKEDFPMIRIATEADIPQILAIYAPYIQNTTYSFEFTVPTETEFTQRFREITRQFPWLVWEEDGCIAGYAYASAPFTRAAYAWCAEPSIYLAPEAQGKGIGRKLYAALEAILTQQGYQLSYAIITSSNTGSLAFHKAVGYEFLAEFPQCGFKFQQWHGIIWLQKRLNSVETPIERPASWPEFVKNNRNLSQILVDLTLS